MACVGRAWCFSPFPEILENISWWHILGLQDMYVFKCSTIALTEITWFRGTCILTFSCFGSQAHGAVWNHALLKHVSVCIGWLLIEMVFCHIASHYLLILVHLNSFFQQQVQQGIFYPDLLLRCLPSPKAAPQQRLLGFQGGRGRFSWIVVMQLWGQY